MYLILEAHIQEQGFAERTYQKRWGFQLTKLYHMTFGEILLAHALCLKVPCFSSTAQKRAEKHPDVWFSDSAKTDICHNVVTGLAQEGDTFSLLGNNSFYALFPR